jgi:hypothetical protein
MDGNEAGACADAAEALATTVRDWVVNHFKTKDARLHKMARPPSAGPPPLPA